MRSISAVERLLKQLEDGRAYLAILKAGHELDIITGKPLDHPNELIQSDNSDTPDDT